MIAKNYQFLTVEEYFSDNHSVASSQGRSLASSLPRSPCHDVVSRIGRSRIVLLRHDVDSWPSNAMQMAKLENEYGIKSTYYFRRHWQSFNTKIIMEIASLGHEIGYHYEDLANSKGNYAKAFDEFKMNLEKIKKLYPVKTISMHGRPLSKWDSRDLWGKYDYKDLGILCEPYLDIDYDNVLYLTDTGGCWDGEKYSLRDNVKSKFNYDIHSTFDLIDHIEQNKLPDQIILNVHPARWNNNLFKWLIRQFILTYSKRGIKSLLKKMRNK